MWAKLVYREVKRFFSFQIESGDTIHPQAYLDSELSSFWSTRVLLGGQEERNERCIGACACITGLPSARLLMAIDKVIKYTVPTFF